MEKIDLVEILKDCPTGMELDSPVWNNIVFEEIDCGNIVIFRKSIGAKVYLTQYGAVNNIDGNCVIFPKGKTTWEGFHRPFKDGDILATDLGSVFYLNTRLIDDERYGCYVGIGGDGSFLHICESFAYKECCGFATEEEKEKLFKAIKDNGYKWNPETKTLEKLIVPKFKVGDIIQDIDTYKVKITEVNIEDECYGYESMIAKGIGSITFSEQDNWKLAQNKLVKPRFKVGDRIIKKNGVRVPILITNISDEFYYSNTGSSVGVLSISEQDEYTLLPNKFDINTLKPFDKVLVRDCNSHVWNIQFFEKYKSGKFPFICMGYNKYKECIPYEGNEHLLDTADNCDEYFKNWE